MEYGNTIAVHSQTCSIKASSQDSHETQTSTRYKGQQFMYKHEYACKLASKFVIHEGSLEIGEQV